MNIDNELYKIINKYDIYDCNPRYKLYGRICELFGNMIASIPKDKKIALRGGGVHSLMFLSGLGDTANRIDYIIEKKNVEFTPYIQKSIMLNDVSKEQLDYIIISSYKYREEMKLELIEMGCSATVIDPYEVLEKNGIVLTTHFYDLIADGYVEIYNNICKIHCKEKKQIEIAYQNIIASYIKMRDFLNAFQWIERYKKFNSDDGVRYEAFQKDCEKLLSEIQQKIQEKNMPHVVCNWIDAMMPKGLQHAPFLMKQSKEGVYFENAYTFSPYTSANFYTLNTGKKVIEDVWNPQMCFSKENSKLLHELDRKGYRFKYCGQHFLAKLSGENLCDSFHVSHCVVGPDSYYVPMTLWKWDCLQMMIDAQCPLFIMIHIMETHTPFVSGLLEHQPDLRSVCPFPFDLPIKEEESIRWEQWKNANEYVDKEIEWYSRFDSSNQINMYMSDHGLVLPKEDYYDNLSQIVFIINGENIKAHKYNSVFSNFFFSDIVNDIVNDSWDFSKYEKEYAIIEMIPPYNRGYINNFVDKYYACNDTLCIDIGLSKKIYRSLREYYVLYETGEEKYYCDDLLGMKTDEEIQSRKRELRELVGTQFIDVNKNEMYSSSRIFRDMFIKERENWIELI